MADRFADPNGAPPLLVWPLTLAFATILVMGLRLWVADAWQSDATPTCAAQWSKPSAAAGAFRILAIGNSLLRNGTEPSAEFEALLNGASWQLCIIGSPVNMAAVRQSFGDRQVDVLLLAEGIIRTGHTVDYTMAFAKTVTEQFWALLLPHSIPVRAVGGSNPFCSYVRREPREPESYQSLLDLQDSTEQDAIDGIRSIRSGGTLVIIVDIPRSAALEARVAASLQPRRSRLQHIAQAADAQYWRFPAPVADGAYCNDGAHMAPAGRTDFAPRLAQRLRDLPQAGAS
jgi:hypothetical protein